MKTFIKPTSIIGYGKRLEQTMGLEKLTASFNDFRWAVGMRRPVKPQTVHRYNNGKSGYQDGVHNPYTMFLEAYNLLSRKKL